MAGRCAAQFVARPDGQQLSRDRTFGTLGIDVLTLGILRSFGEQASFGALATLTLDNTLAPAALGGVRAADQRSTTSAF